MKLSMALKTLLGAASVALPLMALAESNVQTGAGTLTATAHVDFQVVIPQILYLRVGNGSMYSTGVLASNAAVDQIVFSPTAAVLGNGTAVAASSGGDAGVGVETAAVVGNGGNVTLSSSTAGALNDGAADTINYTQITTTPSTLTSGTALPAPALANGAGGSVTLTAVGKIVNQDAKWTYAYANSAPVPAAGTYGGGGLTNVNNGRVTYTASMP